MTSETISNKFEHKMKASASQAFKSFTNATRLRFWLSDGATTAPRPGGRLIMWWNDGNYASGEYEQLEKDSRISFVLAGKKQTALTNVTVSIKEVEGGSQVHLEETGPGIGVNWSEALENLTSILETGLDLRVVRRPMLGISISDFNETIAAQLGTPVTSGIRIDNVLDNMGAKAAGIQKDDVIVSLGGKEADNFGSLQTALKNYKAGDWVEVDFYRGSEYKTANMELSRRPIPEIPSDPVQLAEADGEKFDEAFAELERLLEGVSEEEAAYKPGPDEWSAKETIAHLIIGEREFNGWVSDYISDQVRWSDDWGGNLHERGQAVVAAFPALSELLDQLRRLGKENQALLSRMPASTVENKASYRTVGAFILESPTHIREHFEQIQKAVEAARG